MTVKKFKLCELVRDLEVEIQGDENCVIEGVTTLEDGKSGHLTFLNNPKYKKYLSDTTAAAVVLTRKEAEDCPVTAVICRDPYFTYAKMASYFLPELEREEGVHPSASVHSSAQVDKTASIAPQAVISKNACIGAHVVIGGGCFIGEGVVIGDHTVLHANVTLYHDVKIGKHVIISSGTVIGADGFGIAKHAGVWHKVPQLGTVIIEDDVEIGANCAIDRGAIGDTIIAKGVKLDNLIQVGHNVQIGAYTAIAGCVGIAGSATIGKNCLIGGGAGIAGHIEIGDDIMITGMTAVTKSLRNPGIYSSGVGGVVTNKEWQKTSARLHRLNSLTEKVKKLEQLIKEMIN